MDRREQEKRTLRYSDARKRIDGHEQGFIPTTWKIPEGMESFRFKKAGMYKIDIMPFIVGKGNRFAEEGEIYWERTFYSHRGIGANKQDYCCLRRNWGEPCPVCEFSQKLRSDPSTSEEKIRAFTEKERQLFLFFDKSTQESREKRIQVYETSHYKAFGEMLEKELKFARAESNDNPILRFFYLDGGMTLTIMAEDQTWTGGSFVGPTKIQFSTRSVAYDEAILDEAPCLDNLLIKVPYAELKRILHQTPEKEEQKEQEPSKGISLPSRSMTTGTSNGASPAHEEELKPLAKFPPKLKTGPTAESKGLSVGDIVIHSGYGNCGIKSISTDGTTLVVEDADGESFRGIPVEEVEKVLPKKPQAKGKSTPKPKEVDEDPVPTPRKTAKSAAKPKPDPDEDEDGEDDMNDDF